MRCYIAQWHSGIRHFLCHGRKSFSDLTSKHEELTLLIEDDTQFEDEEKWLLDVQETFMRLKIDTKDNMIIDDVNGRWSLMSLSYNH